MKKAAGRHIFFKAHKNLRTGFNICYIPKPLLTPASKSFTCYGIIRTDKNGGHFVKAVYLDLYRKYSAIVLKYFVSQKVAKIGLYYFIKSVSGKEPLCNKRIFCT